MIRCRLFDIFNVDNLCPNFVPLARLPLSHKNSAHYIHYLFLILLAILFISDVPLVSLELGSTLNGSVIKEGVDVYFECNIKSNPWVYKVSWRHNVSVWFALWQMVLNDVCCRVNNCIIMHKQTRLWAIRAWYFNRSLRPDLDITPALDIIRKGMEKAIQFNSTLNVSGKWIQFGFALI